MGEEEQVDPQKLKKIAAAAYDYESDSRWADYWSNILIPPHMASRSDVVDHFKHKFYQRYIDPGLVVEPMSLSGSSQSTRQTSSSSSTSTPAPEQARPHSSGSSSRTSASGESTTSSTDPNLTALRWDQQTIQFFIAAWVFVLAVLAIFPVIPSNISNRAYRLCFMGTAGSSLYNLYSLYGTPREWNMQVVQLWLQSVIMAKDFIYFFYSLMFGSSHLCLKFALIPILCRSIELVARFLRRNVNRSTLYRKYLEDLCVWVESNVTTLYILSSHAEVGLGFLLIISLLSWQRNFIQTFMYWHLLKLMYHAPITGAYHHSIWTKIGQSTDPAILRYAPFLNTPLSFIKRWWLR